MALLNTCELRPLGICDDAISTLPFGCILRRAELMALGLVHYIVRKRVSSVSTERATDHGLFRWFVQGG